jgi:hypothetical protein
MQSDYVRLARADPWMGKVLGDRVIRDKSNDCHYDECEA